VASIASRTAGYNKAKGASARIKYKNAVAARLLKAKIAKELKAGARKGVEAAVRFLASRIKETLNVPAPKRNVMAPGGGIAYRVATVAAIPGAPPRKLSGRLQASVTHKMLTPTVGIVGTGARSDKGFNYPAFHELGMVGRGKNRTFGRWGGGKHTFIKPTAEKYHKELRTIVGAEVRVQLRIKR
jgi:hypothetical protein